MSDTISRQAALDALCAVCGNDCDKSEFVYNAPQDEQVIICPEHYCLCTLPPAQPTLYGYDIKVLAFVASVMAKEGMSPEEAVTTFRDINRVIEIMLEDMRDGARRTLEQMFAGGQDGTV